MIKKHLLNFQQAKNYFEDNLNGVNELSNFVISILKFERGNFFALLMEDSAIKDINDLKSGGKTICLRNEVSEFIFTSLKSKKNISCIFDDFNSDEKNIQGDSLFNSNGLFYNMEVYYLINKNASRDLVAQCLRRSNVIWHSLCILSEIEFDENKKTITQDEMKEICLKARLILIGAYDAESYVMWEKTDPEETASLYRS